MAGYASTLCTGDAILARVDSSVSGRVEQVTVDAIVVRPVIIGVPTIVVDMRLPGGSSERREISIDSLLAPPTRSRRVQPAQRLGEGDGWGDGAPRSWSSSDHCAHSGAAETHAASSMEHGNLMGARSSEDADGEAWSLSMRATAAIRLAAVG